MRETDFGNPLEKQLFIADRLAHLQYAVSRRTDAEYSSMWIDQSRTTTATGGVSDRKGINLRGEGYHFPRTGKRMTIFSLKRDLENLGAEEQAEEIIFPKPA